MVCCGEGVMVVGMGVQLHVEAVQQGVGGGSGRWRARNNKRKLEGQKQ
jgi:hypothetical protein